MLHSSPSLLATKLRSAFDATVFISGKSQVPMLQLLCNTFGKADNFNANTSVITEFYLYACLKDSIMVRCGKEDKMLYRCSVK